MYVFCKAPLPIDVDFMLNDSLEVGAFYAPFIAIITGFIRL